MQFTDPEHPNNVLVVKDSSIQGPGDLAGKSVGVPTLTGASAQAVLYVAMQAGVDQDDVKLVQTPFDTQADQLNAGRIDAAVSAIPFFTAQEKAGLQIRDDVIVEAVKAATDGSQDRATTATFIATPSFANDNAEVIEAWRKSLQQAIDFIDSNEAEARKLLETWLKLPPEIAQEAPLPGLAVDIPASDIAPYAEIGETLGTLKGDVPDAESLIYKGQ
jgi:ABC-type nitrate/sulfonate/bicarbonate transport system substrate-binding protein